MDGEDDVPKGYDRVSDILSIFSDFSNIAPAVLKNAAHRGTRVHHFCDMHAQNMFLESIDEDCQFYFDSFTRWFSENVESHEHSERRINSSQYMLSGKFDMIVKLKGDYGSTLVDLKTPRTASPSWQLQTAAYQSLIQHELGIPIQRRIAVMLSPSGGAAKIVEYKDYDGDYMRFLNAMELYRFFKRKTVCGEVLEDIL